MHYVIGDVHGCYDELMALINKIESEDADAEFIFVGDFVDRGRQVDLVLDWCLNNITDNGKYTSVRGNHEEMIIEWYHNLWLKWWNRFRDYSVINMPESDYDFSKWMDGMNKLTPEGMEPYIKFFSSLPYSRELEITTTSGIKQKYMIVHAAYCFEKISEARQKQYNIWERNYDGNTKNDVIVVHGHTPTITNEYIYQYSGIHHPGMICYSKNDINIDGGCVFSERSLRYPSYLCAICLENLKEIYSCTLEERFAQKSSDSVMAQIYLEKYTEEYMSEESEYRKEMLKRLKLE